MLNENGKYSTKLSDSEIEALSYKVTWLGPKAKTVFEENDQKAVEALSSIIADYNAMVPQEEFHGFVIASLVTHLRAYLYQHILAEQKDFYSSITLSGQQVETGEFVNLKCAHRAQRLAAPVDVTPGL